MSGVGNGRKPLFPVIERGAVNAYPFSDLEVCKALLGPPLEKHKPVL